MINKGVKLTAGLLVAALFVTMIPTNSFEAKAAESKDYITGASYSFSAGAHSAISETVVLNDITDDELLAGIVENDAPTVAGPSIYADIAIAQVNGYLNIRAEADHNAKVLGKLYNNGAARVLETLDGWYKVTSGDVTGYIAAENLVVGDEAICKAAAKKIGTILDTSVRLRKEANTNCSVLTKLHTNYKVTVLDDTLGAWCKVQYGSYVGYVASRYVEVGEDFEYAEPTTGGKAVVNFALKYVGNPYVWGGTSLTKGADCSGFVMKVYEQFGVSLPHSSYALRYVGYAVSAEDVKPGDIICYSGHVAIYIGDGAIVHASNRKEGIKITYNWKYKPVVAIRRVF